MRRRPRLRRRASLVPGAILAGAAAVLLLVGTPFAHGALTASVANTTNSVESNGYFTCTAAAVGSAGLGSYSTWPLADAAGSATAADVSGNNHPGSYTALDLGVTFGVAGPCPRDYARAVTFNGLTGSVADPTGYTLTTTSAQTDEVWFRTTTTAGGVLITSYSATTVLAGGCDRVLYMTSTGHLVFGVYNGAVQAIESPAAYNNGTWNLAEGVFGAGGISLYVDGVLVASNPADTTADPFTAYTRLASGQLNGWPTEGGAALPAYWSGSEAFASIYHYALSATQAAEHYAAGH